MRGLIGAGYSFVMPHQTLIDEENSMNIQPQPTAPAVANDKSPIMKMKLRFHVCPDARSTTRICYRSAWARRYGRSNPAN